VPVLPVTGAQAADVRLRQGSESPVQRGLGPGIEEEPGVLGLRPLHGPVAAADAALVLEGEPRPVLTREAGGLLARSASAPA
jgi:poly(A) polymerase